MYYYFYLKSYTNYNTTHYQLVILHFQTKYKLLFNRFYIIV